MRNARGNDALITYFDQHAVDLRSLPNSDPRWSKIHAGKYHKLAWCYAIPLPKWIPLAQWEREVLDVYAHARTAPKAILLGKAAAIIHGIPLVSPAREYHATVPSNSVPQRRKAHFFTYKQTQLRGQVQHVHGLQLTSLARTAIDIARFHGFAEGLVATDYVRGLGVGKARLDSVLGAMGRVKGVGQARAAVARSIRESESPWESYARGLLLEAELPGVQQVRAQYGVGQHRADLAVNGWLLIEIDGNVKYADEPAEVIRAEHRRQQSLLNRGYVVLRFSPTQLRQAPAEFLGTVERQVAAGPRRLDLADPQT